MKSPVPFSLFKDSRWENDTAGTLLSMLSVSQAVLAKTCSPLSLISVEDCPLHYVGRNLRVIVYISVHAPPLLKPSSGWIKPGPMCVPFSIKILKKGEEENYSIVGFWGHN